MGWKSTEAWPEALRLFHLGEEALNTDTLHAQSVSQEVLAVVSLFPSVPASGCCGRYWTPWACGPILSLCSCSFPCAVGMQSEAVAAGSGSACPVCGRCWVFREQGSSSFELVYTEGFCAFVLSLCVCHFCFAFLFFFCFSPKFCSLIGVCYQATAEQQSGRFVKDGSTRWD